MFPLLSLSLPVLQESMEALQSCVSVSLPADFPSLHGLHDLSVLPHGLLAPHYHLLVHPHLAAGNTHADVTPRCWYLMYMKVSSSYRQVLGTLLIYVLFMVEEFRKAPVENMDEVIYYVNGTYRLLEFLVSVTHGRQKHHVMVRRLLNTLLVAGCRVRGVLRCVRDRLWGMECDGEHDHPGALVLQRLAKSPAGLAKLPAQERRCQQDQEPPHSQQRTAGTVQ